MPSTGDPHGDCVARINQLRAECQCLPPLARWREAEDCADQMAEYDAVNGTVHGGFGRRICSPTGANQSSCGGSSWASAPERDYIEDCLQDMWDEGPGDTIEYAHYMMLSSTRYTRVACGFYVSGGQFEGVSNFGYDGSDSGPFGF